MAVKGPQYQKPFQIKNDNNNNINPYTGLSFGMMKGGSTAISNTKQSQFKEFQNHVPISDSQSQDMNLLYQNHLDNADAKTNPIFLGKQVDQQNINLFNQKILNESIQNFATTGHNSLNHTKQGRVDFVIDSINQDTRGELSPEQRHYMQAQNFKLLIQSHQPAIGFQAPHYPMGNKQLSETVSKGPLSQQSMIEMTTKNEPTVGMNTQDQTSKVADSKAYICVQDKDYAQFKYADQDINAQIIQQQNCLPQKKVFTNTNQSNQFTSGYLKTTNYNNFGGVAQMNISSYGKQGRQSPFERHHNANMQSLQNKKNSKKRVNEDGLGICLQGQKKPCHIQTHQQQNQHKGSLEGHKSTILKQAYSKDKIGITGSERTNEPMLAIVQEDKIKGFYNTSTQARQVLTMPNSANNEEQVTGVSDTNFISHKRSNPSQNNQTTKQNDIVSINEAYKRQDVIPGKDKTISIDTKQGNSINVGERDESLSWNGLHPLNKPINQSIESNYQTKKGDQIISKRQVNVYQPIPIDNITTKRQRNDENKQGAGQMLTGYQSTHQRLSDTTQQIQNNSEIFRIPNQVNSPFDVKKSLGYNQQVNLGSTAASFLPQMGGPVGGTLHYNYKLKLSNKTSPKMQRNIYEQVIQQQIEQQKVEDIIGRGLARQIIEEKGQTSLSSQINQQSIYEKLQSNPTSEQRRGSMSYIDVTQVTNIYQSVNNIIKNPQQTNSSIQAAGQQAMLSGYHLKSPPVEKQQAFKNRHSIGPTQSVQMQVAQQHTALQNQSLNQQTQIDFQNLQNQGIIKLPGQSSKTEFTVSRLPRSSVLPTQVSIDRKVMNKQNMYMNLFQTPQQKVSSKYLLTLKNKNQTEGVQGGTTFKVNSSILTQTHHNKQYLQGAPVNSSQLNSIIDQIVSGGNSNFNDRWANGSKGFDERDLNLLHPSVNKKHINVVQTDSRTNQKVNQSSQDFKNQYENINKNQKVHQQYGTTGMLGAGIATVNFNNAGEIISGTSKRNLKMQDSLESIVSNSVEKNGESLNTSQFVPIKCRSMKAKGSSNQTPIKTNIAKKVAIMNNLSIQNLNRQNRVNPGDNKAQQIDPSSIQVGSTQSPRNINNI